MCRSAALRKAFQKGKLQFHGELQSLVQPAVFEKLCDRAGKIAWVVYGKRPFGRSEQVLKYLVATRTVSPSPTDA
jgi:hypothetical protein